MPNILDKKYGARVYFELNKSDKNKSLLMHQYKMV